MWWIQHGTSTLQTDTEQRRQNHRFVCFDIHVHTLRSSRQRCSVVESLPDTGQYCRHVLETAVMKLVHVGSEKRRSSNFLAIRQD